MYRANTPALTDADVVYGYASYYGHGLRTTVTALLRWNCGA
jgi:hypothetical protein